MRETFLSVILLLIWVSKLIASDMDSTLAGKLTYQLLHVQADPRKAATVNDFKLQRDAGTFYLKDGSLWLCKPVNGKICAAVFMGHGVFTMTPSTDIEKKQLYRIYKTESIEKEFKALFLFFADSTLEELSRRLEFAETKPVDGMDGYIENSRKHIADRFEILNVLLNQDNKRSFYCEISKDLNSSSGSLFFEINPYSDEDIQLMRTYKSNQFGYSDEVISQFHNQSYYSLPSYLRYENKDRFIVDAYKVDCHIDDNFDLTCATDISVKPKVANLNWMFFDLYYKLDVDSVFVDDKKANFFKVKGSYSLWIEADQTIKNSQPSTVRLFYHGEIIVRERNDFYIRSSTDWYPHAIARSKSMFDLTFHQPSQYKVVSVGDKISENEKKYVTTSHWVTKNPVKSATFNIGFFGNYEIKDQRIPPVSIMMSEADHQFVNSDLTVTGFRLNNEKNIGADIANSLAFFQETFGHCSVDRLCVTETPFAHGLAFPGLIHLYAWALATAGATEAFRAHEVAHQWWGIGVDFESYHDQWLSEGFAEYSGLWYMQNILQDNKNFFGMLQSYKEHIIKNRNSLLDRLFGDNQQAGPIWLGYRTDLSTSAGDYDLIIYEKGAWVLHMLRNMMLDLNTMNEDRFKGLMREFYQTYKGQYANTSDFQKMTEKYAGMDMTWFFNEWVYGTDIPSYRFSWKSEKINEKYKVTCRVEQSNTSDDFQMIIPVAVDFGNGQFARMKVIVKGPVSRFDLPLMPMEPKKINFNILESVLCEVKEVEWK